MQRTSLILLAFYLCCACIASAFAGDRFVKVTTPFANVYEYLDPKSAVIEQGKKGQCYKLVYEGTSWYQVSLKGKIGWIDRREGRIVDNPGYIFGSLTPLNVLAMIVLLAGTVGVVFYYINRQQNAEV